jgi:16S rRNA (guanine527-N7)-methyltransferase
MTAGVTPIDRAPLAQELAHGFASINVASNQSVIELMLDYLVLIQKWNRVHNLTAVRDTKKMVSTHLLDSLSVSPHLPDGPLLDVGSGAGLPGIPLAGANRNLQVTLIEASHKKAAFLRQAVAELRLTNVEVVCQKVEEWLPSARFQCIIARAYAEISKLIESSKHLLAENGIFAAMKGRYPEAEIEAIPQEYAVRKVIELKVPGLDAERHLILIGRS